MALIGSYGTAGNDQFTRVLLHFDGADAATGVTDVAAGASAHTFTANGNAQLDTGTTPQFGTAAGLFDGTGDYWSTPDSADFTMGSADFTLDFWFNINTSGNGTNRLICGQMDAAGNNSSISFAALIGTTGLCTFRVGQGGSAIDATAVSAITTTGWHHFAGVREGGNIKLYLDGVLEKTTACTGAINNSSEILAIGRLGAFTTLTYYGSIDEFRVSAGIARWTANFTPPTAAYG